ncbi:MAG: hypothetical protein ACI4U9_04825 [Clostridia bacterium]
MNIHHISVKTKSGTVYELQQEGDKLFIQNGITLSGVVVKLYEPIRIGGILHLDFIKDGLYGTPEKHPMFLRSTKITDIVIR